jgi:hypothetical protein
MKAQGKGIAALLVVAALAVAACHTDAGGEFVTYTGDSGGVRYTLTITENTARYAAQPGDRYELVRESRRSAGTVSDVNGSLLTLRPEIALETTFTASVSGNRLSSLNGRITWTDGSTASAPGRMTGTTYIPPYTPPYSPPSTANPDVWRVVYLANGGEGDMDDDTAEVGTAITLSANKFTRSGCTFAGWAESAAGALLENASITGQAAGTILDIYALWDVEERQEADVVAAATNQIGDTITLTGVEWSDRLGTALETALEDGSITTLNLSGVSGFDEEWDKDTLNDGVKTKITSLILPETVTRLAAGDGSANSAFNGYAKLESVSGTGV